MVTTWVVYFPCCSWWDPTNFVVAASVFLWPYRWIWIFIKDSVLIESCIPLLKREQPQFQALDVATITAVSEITWSIVCVVYTGKKYLSWIHRYVVIRHVRHQSGSRRNNFYLLCLIKHSITFSICSKQKCRKM